MKIVVTGGGTGGHFYPVIAVAQAMRQIIREERLIDAKIYFMAPSPYNDRLLYENNIIFKQSYAGKMRRYFSLMNAVDAVKTFFGVLRAILTMYSIFPDVVFGKGGYVSFPVLVAARFFGIPVVIHESDSKPGRVNLWAGKFAKKIAVSYKEAAAYFPKEKVAHTGNPIRPGIAVPMKEGTREHWGIDSTTPVLFVIGGSQGSRKMNDTIIDALPELLNHFYVIHQTGKTNIREVSGTADVVLNGHPNKNRYKPVPYLNDLELRNAAGAADLIISRAGSSIFEIAAWGKPSIIIPIPQAVSHDQTGNAFAYASTGACSVIQETNLSTHILISEIKRITDSPEMMQRMAVATQAFRYPDAARKIAQEIISIALTHYTA
jgi:UDP-N-acetylglucosamine--N-acetylmuramyl-(pentapeptide) pyrophosphoryl-undecaprenol N-acetylglucosamine transferase